MRSLTRRQLLGSSLTFGVGAVGLTGIGPEAWASPSLDAVAPPAAPEPVQTFVSRPDLRPPGVEISAVRNLPGRPARIFLAPRVAGSGQPVSSQGLMIMDLSGNLVWWRQMSALNAYPFNFRVQTYRGKSVLTWYQGHVPYSYGIAGTGMIADDTYTEIASAHARNGGTDLHEFLITPQDTALVTAYEQDGKLTIGHAQEVAIGGSNELLWDWACYPAVPPSLSYTGRTGDYFHINSVDLWPGPARDLLISSRNTSAAYLVSRRTKKIIWRLGGKASSFAMRPGTKFSYQHDVRALADGSGVSLFDDASGGVPEKQSWGKVITLETGPARATLRHQYRHTTSAIDTGSQGNCQLLPTGGHFVGWGANPYFSLYGPSGPSIQAPLLLDGRLPDGFQNYRAFMFDWTGRPPLRELVAVVHTGDAHGKFYAYTSWNGATQVSYYEVSAGTASSQLKTVSGPVPSRTFETVIPFTANGATDFQVRAYTAKGHLLGHTPIVGAT